MLLFRVGKNTSIREGNDKENIAGMGMGKTAPIWQGFENAQNWLVEM